MFSVLWTYELLARKLWVNVIHINRKPVQHLPAITYRLNGRTFPAFPWQPEQPVKHNASRLLSVLPGGWSTGLIWFAANSGSGPAGLCGAGCSSEKHAA